MNDQTSAIEQLYVAFFNRPGDVAGEAYWENALHMYGGNVAAIASRFAASSEYQNLFTGMNNDQIVNTLYTNLFGRPAEPAGLHYWSAQLAAGTQTVSSIALTLLQSAQGSDADAVNSKLGAATIFTNYLSHATDPSISNAYTSANTTFLAREWLSKVINTTTMFANTAPNIISDLARDMNSFNLPGNSISLTPNTDTLIGGSVPTTFTGTLGQNGTLNGVDTIKGGSGNDVLQLTNLNPGVSSFPVTVNVSNIHTLNVAALGSVGNNLDPGSVFDVTGISGLATLNVDSGGPDAIKAPGTTDINIIQRSDANTNGAISVTGGANINITNRASGTVSITGAADMTSSVSITGSNGVTIVDANASTPQASVLGSATTAALAYHAAGSGANSISKVTLIDVSGSSVIDSDALSDLVLYRSYGITLSDARITTINAASGARNLNLKLVGSGGTLNDATATSIKIDTYASGAANASATVPSLELNAQSASSITFEGPSHLIFTPDNINNASAITLTGNGGVSGVSVFGAPNAIFDATTSNGKNTLMLSAGQSYLGGSGASIITDNGVPLVPVNGGSSGNNSIEISNVVDTRVLTPASGSLISNFQTMVLSGNWGIVNADFKLTNLPTLINGLVLTGTQGNASTISSSANTFYLTLSTTHDPSTDAKVVTYVTSAPVANSSLTLQLGNTNSSDYSVIADGVSSLNILSNNGWNTSSTLHASSFASARHVSLSGNSTLDMSDVTLQASLIDASNFQGSLSIKSGLTTGASIKLSGYTTNLVGLADSVHGDTISQSWTSTDAHFVVTEGDGNNVININDGANIVTVGNGNNTITVGNHDSDSVTAGNGNNIIRVGDGKLNHITVGTGSNTVTLGHGTGQTVTIHGAGANLNTFTTITGFQASDNLEFDAKINTFASAKITALNDSTATLQQFADYAVKNLATNSGSVAWFQYKGDTYVIENVHGSESNFTNGTDVAVKLTGLIDLSAASIALGQLHY